jgi:hypothetical protein
MEIVQKSYRVGFYLKISIETKWDPEKVKGAPFFLYFWKKCGVLPFFRKSAPTIAPPDNKENGWG